MDSRLVNQERQEHIILTCWSRRHTHDSWGCGFKLLENINLEQNKAYSTEIL